MRTHRRRPPHGYVLEDASVHASPDTWARRVITAYYKWRADRCVCEGNQGQALVSHVLRTLAPNLPVTMVHASR
jgi:phage terminase large subunit-like protein